ncbi:PASTA domain-containing protein [Prevotella sp.]|uniref:PASTA domain-containing protein n=1 Tax=Prevotella sp. TaxID=59823 RepID=UPI003FD7FBFB
MSAKLWANLGAMLLVVVLLCLGVRFGLDLYTHHGEEIEVPNIKHKLFTDAEQLLSNRGLEIEVSDTGYVRSLPPDCILDQVIAPGTKVKRGRVIYVVINSDHSPMLTLPDLIDNNSYREARANLIAMGFKVGPPQYVSGEKEWVYGITCRGQNLHNGQRVSVDDVLTIQVGDGVMNMDEDITYMDPEYPGNGNDSVNATGLGHNQGVIEGSGGHDEFEVVTGPE